MVQSPITALLFRESQSIPFLTSVSNLVELFISSIEDNENG